MYDQVHVILESYQPGWEINTSFSESVNRFEQLRVSLHEMNETLSQKTMWLTNYKNLLLKECLDEGHTFLRFLKVIALKNDSKKDALKYSVSKRDFTAGFTSDKMNRLHIVVADIQLHSQELVAIGLTQEQTTTFIVKVSELDGIVSQPRTKIVEYASLNEQVKDRNREMLTILYDEIDVLILLFQSTLQEFVDRYFLARNIVDKRGKSNTSNDEESPERDDGENVSE